MSDVGSFKELGLIFQNIYHISLIYEMEGVFKGGRKT